MSSALLSATSQQNREEAKDGAAFSFGLTSGA
jgi:hypothetical protein